MKKLRIYLVAFFALFSMLSGISCINKKTYTSPAGYDLTMPVKYNMPEKLTEISGIAFRNGEKDSIYAEEDEKGRVYYFKLGDKEIKHSEFGKAGDYEDIAMLGNQVIMLRSDGVLFVFPFNQLINSPISSVQKLDDVLPQGEYEGLYGDEKTNRLYALCKHCSNEKTSRVCGIYSFTLAADGTVKKSGEFAINVQDIEAKTGQEKISFHPSALAKNQQTNEWYVLSSVNKMLVVTGSDWKVKAVYPLNPGVFRQPEGIAFDGENNLYISNEGDKITPGNVLKFSYKK
jgi:uncharacterized protein YjiK